MTSSGGETREDPSGWTVDTLRMYMQTQIDQLNTLLNQRFEAQKTAMHTAFVAAEQSTNDNVEAAVDQARQKTINVEAQISDLKTMLDERYATQVKAVDAAFLAQQTAMQTALTAAETAVSKALESAEKAVIKAEISSDKRFEAVNEFRAQLADQARTFMPRSESELAVGRNTERIQELTTEIAKMILRTEAVASDDRNSERIQELTSRINVNEGRGVGQEETNTNQRLNTGQVLLAISVLIGAIGLIITIFVLSGGV